MRTQHEVMDLIVRVANADNRIRAALLGGSRVNSNVPQDILQDFDITYIVSEMNSFVRNHNWIDVFGERLILQMPEEMTIGEKDEHSFHYLMLFKDKIRIDLTLLPVNVVDGYKFESLTVSLLDKDNLLRKLLPPTDADYRIKRPTEKEFKDCCNEFWWVSTYVAKGLWRHEVVYAKAMLEDPVRTMFLKIIEWYIGAKTGFKVSFGKKGRNLKPHVSQELYSRILSTYPNAEIGNIWNSLFVMTDIFVELATVLASDLSFRYNVYEGQNVRDYLKWVHEMKTET